MKTSLVVASLFLFKFGYTWGFYAHGVINYQAIFSLPPELVQFYKQHATYLKEHATDPDKRRYAVPEEGARHFLDMDHYGVYPYASLPRSWEDAICLFSEDTVKRYGIVPWHILVMQARLTKAFYNKDVPAILRNSAELGHYVADAHVPLHACSNHNGQFTGQQGIHGFWESRVPELLAEKNFSFLVGKAHYISNVSNFIWDRVLESAQAADSVLHIEQQLNDQTPPDLKYAFEQRNGIWIRQYSSAYTIAYNNQLHGMVERRMRESIIAVASLWYTAWMNAGQPTLHDLSKKEMSAEEQAQWQQLNKAWRWGFLKGEGCY